MLVLFPVFRLIELPIMEDAACTPKERMDGGQEFNWHSSQPKLGAARRRTMDANASHNVILIKSPF